MEKTYWNMFTLSLFGIIFTVLALGVITILYKTGKIQKQYIWGFILILIILFILSMYILIPCIKDYILVVSHNYIEVSATVVEFTYVRRDLDGNGETEYLKPRFYIESENKYIVLKLSNVEKGKTYRIRYYPHTRICEMLYCIE